LRWADVRVYGSSEGQTRIKSNSSTAGQDATSKSTYGTIRKVYNDPTVTTESEANLLANKLVAKWKEPVKIYEFDVINPYQSFPFDHSYPPKNSNFFNLAFYMTIFSISTICSVLSAM